MNSKWAAHIAKLSTEKIVEIGNNILWFFSHAERFDGGRTFGWDWPTMAVICPKTVAFYRACHAEYRRRSL